MEEKKYSHIDIYTDGSYLKGSDKCGYAAIFVNNGQPVAAIYGAIWDPMYVASWNVGGELKAAEMALDFAQELGVDSVDLYHDYEGVSKWVLGKWKCNKELTRHYVQLMRLSMKHIPVTFHHVRGHSGNRFNDLADRYAAKGAKHPFPNEPDERCKYSRCVRFDVR